MPHPLQLLLLGDFRLLRDGQQVGTVNTPRQQSLLAYLALRRRAPQPRAHVASLFWPDSSEKQGLTNLRHLLHDLRKAVPQLDDLISGDARSLAWNPQATAGLDVAELERALADADRAPDDARARSALAHAAALYGGPLLPECRDAWIEPERERLHREAARALRRLAGALEAAGDYAGALQQASRLLAIEPLHEASYELSMRLHMLAGDRAAALQSYESCERVLGRELGLSPGPALRELRERARAAAPLGERAAAPSTTRAVSEPTLHGRRRQWRQLCAAWQDAAGGRAQSIVILGEAGIGKTRPADVPRAS